MIDVDHEKIVTLTAATKIVPSRPNLSTIWRWRLRGVRGVTLETTMIGGKRYTSLEALKRFQDRVTAAADGVPTAAETPRQRERAIDRAERRAAELGV